MESKKSIENDDNMIITTDDDDYHVKYDDDNKNQWITKKNEIKQNNDKQTTRMKLSSTLHLWHSYHYYSTNVN